MNSKKAITRPGAPALGKGPDRIDALAAKSGATQYQFYDCGVVLMPCTPILDCTSSLNRLYERVTWPKKRRRRKRQRRKRPPKRRSKSGEGDFWRAWFTSPAGTADCRNGADRRKSCHQMIRPDLYADRCCIKVRFFVGIGVDLRCRCSVRKQDSPGSSDAAKPADLDGDRAQSPAHPLGSGPAGRRLTASISIREMSCASGSPSRAAEV
jgi:hypothetical protein